MAKKKRKLNKYLTLVNNMQAKVFRGKYTTICNFLKKHKRQINED